MYNFTTMNKAQLPIFNYSIKNQSETAVDIYIDGDIVDASTQAFIKAYWGDDTSVSYKSFRDQVTQSEATVFNVYINSGGGQVTEAMAIHDLLQELQNNGKTVNTIGRGIVASSATYILMAGKSPSMSSNSFLMIHNVSGAVYGSVNEIENYASTMRKFNDKINSFYQEFTGLSKTVVSNLMDAESWLTAEDAKAKGFVKNVTGAVSFSNSIKPEKWIFENKSILNTYNSFTKQNDPTMDTSKISEAITNGFNSLLEKLGIKDKANDENVKNAFAEFSKGITDHLKDVPDNSSIEEFVNKAVAKSMETVPENFTKAINDAIKDTATKEDVKNGIEEGLKNTLTTEAFNKEMKDVKQAIIDKVGGITNTGEKEKEDKKKAPKNRFAASYEDYYQN